LYQTFLELNFSNAITTWYENNKRDLPWRKTRDPYLIWLSEIILQQTRVDQGLTYYLKFSDRFPTVQSMSNADESQVLKLWQGLGYYSRARNMHFTAKHICNNLNGDFPDNYAELIKLKGVGEYTAAAIASFCFNEKKAVVDGNVFRVLSRYYGLHTPIDSSKGKKEFTQLANELICKEFPGDHNQAIMEYGALLCKPKKPHCSNCKLATSCIAFNKNEISKLPFKSKKIKQKKRYFNYFIVTDGESVFFEQRNKKDIWEKLYQFPMIETNEEVHEIPKNSILANLEVAQIDIRTLKHVLSHQIIYAKFWLFKSAKPIDQNQNMNCVNIKDLDNYAVPKLVDNYLLEFFQLIN
jgi:A/G-specific adenine glycosylase